MMTIEITYKSGRKLTAKAYYIHTENDRLYYGEVSNPHGIADNRVSIPLRNIESFCVDPKE